MPSRLIRISGITPAAILLILFTRVGVAYAVPVTLTITRVQALITEPDEGLEALGESTADLYAEVNINGVNFSTVGIHVDDDPIIEPFWVFTTNVPLAQGTANVTIKIFDHDTSSPDDHADADPGSGRNVDLVVNLATGTWGGETTNSCSTGTGEEGVKVCWDISVLSASGDADGDALLDGWEVNGYDADGDGVIDVDLPGFGADPFRKDLFVEVDCLVSDFNNNNSLADLQDHSHCPGQNAIADVVQAFANAPVPNPDGTTGIQLFVDVGTLYGGFIIVVAGTGGVSGGYGDLGGGGDQIPEAGNLIIDWDGAAGDPATSVYALKAANFNPLRAHVFRYGLFGHQTNARSPVNDCTSGWAEGIPCNDFIVTLGGRRDLDGDGVPDTECWTSSNANGLDDDGDGLVDEDPPDGIDNDGDCPGDTDGDGVICGSGDIGVDEDGGFSVGSRGECAGTFMHEFGHCLGLRHGGGDSINNKPNYPSVMNYNWQPCTLQASPSGTLPGGCDYSPIALSPLNETSLDECVGVGGGLGFGSMDWDQDMTLEGTTNCVPPNNANVSADINNDSAISTLNGFNDWNNIFFPFRTVPEFANGVASPVADEPDAEIIEKSQRFLGQLLQPVLVVDKTGPGCAFPGDTLLYVVQVANEGFGPALNVVLTDTRPDATQVVFDLGTMQLGAEETRLVGFNVPSNAAPGKIANEAEVRYVDFAANKKNATAIFETEVLPCPQDITVECTSFGGTPATDPAIAAFLATPGAAAIDCDVSHDAPAFFDLGTTTVTFTATDTNGNATTCTAIVEVVDTTPPIIECNAPDAIGPPDAPISFTATAQDICDPNPFVEITEFDCFKFTKKGKRIDKTQSCEVEINGVTITIVDSGGVHDHITWIVRATDVSENVAEVQCEVLVVNPGK